MADQEDKKELINGDASSVEEQTVRPKGVADVSGEYIIPELDGNLSLDDLLAQLEEEDRKEKAAADAKSKQEAAESLKASSRLIDSQQKTQTEQFISELITARSDIRRIEGEKQELYDLLQKRQADFDNFRKRTERERGETFNRIVKDVIISLLPTIDNLERALMVKEKIEAGENLEFQNFLHGVELIFIQLNDALANLGVKPIPTVGEKFDPHIHEAVVTEESDQYAPDTVIQELRRGYIIGETLIRPAMVKVSTKL